MKHYAQNTPEALACRADHIGDFGPVSDYIPDSEDYRAVQVYFRHVDAEFSWRGECFYGRAGEVIGVVLGGDDPDFVPEVLDREGARDRFGDHFVTWCEDSRTEALEYGK